MALTTCITRANTSTRRESAALAWPVGKSQLYWEIDSAQFTSGTVLVTIDVSFDGGLTWKRTKSAAFDWNAERLNVVKNGAASAPIAGWHGPFMFGPGHHPTGLTITNPLGEIVNPTHFKIAVASAAGTPRVGMRYDA